MRKESEHKATIETLINISAITLTATGTNLLIGKDWWGFILIIFGVGLEYFKYKGRKNKLW